MNGCKINSTQDFIDDIVKICDHSCQLDTNEGSVYIKQQIAELIRIAKTTSEPEAQLQLLNEALDAFYSNPTDEYGQFLSIMFSKGDAALLFNPDYDETLAEDKAVSSTYEEAAKAGRILRQKNFLDTKFKNAPNAKLYFKRSTLYDMVETFLVERSGDNPRYFTTQSEMNESVKLFKQRLLDRVFTYFEETPLMPSVAALPHQMYKDGKYTGVIEKIAPTINSKLNPQMFTGSVKSLETFYAEYRDGDPVISKNAERFLQAYNAWIILQNFDTIVQDTFGSIIKINDPNNKHDHDLVKYEIKGRATNMWNNWTATDDIASMSEVISDVTQALLDTSRMYAWKSSEAYPDRYVSFHDFNYIIGLIKKQAVNSASDEIYLHSLSGIDKVSLDTKRVMYEIIAWNREHGNYERNADGTATNRPKAVTLKQLISRMNENPQKYLHAIFDIMCNTDILENDQFRDLNDYDKSVLWSFYKEVFGGDGNPRSLYRLHSITNQDSVYQIITQVAASTFPEEYLQYYEKLDGTISSRLLQDYAVDGIKNTIFNNIQETAVTLTSDQYSKYGISYTVRPDQPTYLGEAWIKIPINSELTFTIQATSNRVYINSYTPEQMDLIWKNPQVQSLFKDLLGVNFESDPDLKNAYMEIVRSSTGAIENLGTLLGRVVYSAIVNNEFVPKHPKALTDSQELKAFISNQYGTSQVNNYFSKVNWDTGLIPVLPLDLRDAALGTLALATAINGNLLSAAQSKTGEGTSLANYTLSRMRNFYPNQIEMQCKKQASAVKDLTFVINSNGLFEGLLTRREMKTLGTNQQSTKFSDVQSFQLSFIKDFVSGYIPNPDSKDLFKNGRVSFLPTVNSDKPQIDGLLVNLTAKSSIPDGRGGFKTYLELTDAEIETEMRKEFKGMYKSIITNISNELEKVYNLLPEAIKRTYVIDNKSVLSRHHSILFALNQAFASNTTLGKTPKARITNGLHQLVTTYNQTHRRNPIMIAPQVHYIFDNNGELTSNKTLEALYGRFSEDLSPEDRAYITALYKNEPNYLGVVNTNDINDVIGTKAFCKWNDYLTAKDLLEKKFEIVLRGSDTRVRHNQAEIKFLRGDAVFTEAQLNDPNYAHIRSLSAEMKNWVSDSGLLVIAKGLINGVEVNITSLKELDAATNIRLHPMLSRLNRLDYLCTQQYTISTVGSHYVHQGDKKENVGFVLAEESKRWLASNKRNVAATSTVHLFQNKQLDGAPSFYNIAIIDDIRSDLYSIMGDLYREGHAPLDGGMFCNAFLPDLENNSLAGEKAGWDKKHFGTFYSEAYGAGGIIKTAGFAANNYRMRRSKAWQNLQRNMSDHVWIKEHADEQGNDVPETLDITKNYFGQNIDYTQAIGGKPIMYKRPAHDNPSEMAAYKLHDLVSEGNNWYTIKEVEINSEGVEIGPIVERKVQINTNWLLFTEVFGGWNSLELDAKGKLQWSENSLKLVVHAVNNVGYRKNNDHIYKEAEVYETAEEVANLRKHGDSVKTGLDQDDIWQPLKYADIHLTPNIGAIKSLQFNLNPDGEAVLESKIPMNFMKIRLAQLGIQLDKEHHADAADVSMPTQIIQALANRSFTEYDKEVYDALATLTRQATQSLLEGVSDILQGDSPDVLMEEVTNLILDNLINQSSEDNSVNAILKDLLEKAEQGKTIKYADDIKGKIAWSDPTISNKLFSALSSTLTNIAVKMKFSGSLSVICPTEKIEARYGDRSLDSFSKVYNPDGTTRTSITDNALTDYQKSVVKGLETDADGRNLLIYDELRDTYELPPQGLEETPDQYQQRIRRDSRRKKLSRVSELKTQHHYVVEFSDGSSEEITINTPEEYYQVKNWICFGKRDGVGKMLIKPISYDELLETTARNLDLTREDFRHTPMGAIYEALSTPVLLQDSYKKELGVSTAEAKKMFGLFKSKAKGGITIEQLAEDIYHEYPELYEDDIQVRSMIIDVLSSAHTMGDILNYQKQLILDRAAQEADVAYSNYARDIWEAHQMSPEEYEVYYHKEVDKAPQVTKIYENVTKGRSLGAYNVRFSDNTTGDKFQIFDLDSVNLLFKFNNLVVDPKKQVKGYILFTQRNQQEQQVLLSQIFRSSAFPKHEVYKILKAKYTELPAFDDEFVAKCPYNLSEVVADLGKVAYPRVHKRMQEDLFRLSESYEGADRTVFANGRAVNPVEIETEAYELIMPQVYKTVFGLQENDDVQEILKDEDFFVKRGLTRFQCQLSHGEYDYELKRFNGDHVYILDSSQGIPEHFKNHIQTIFTETRKGKTYRVDSDRKVIYELSSENDRVCKIGNTQIIVTENPLFYVQNLNYNTLKVSPERVTQESYDKLTETLAVSKRANSKNFIKAISTPDGSYISLKEFKKFNTALDSLTYETVKHNAQQLTDFKSVAQICRIILKNGRELHTSFRKSLDIVAGRIPAQSQQSFMIQRVVGFDASGLNTAMVSTFQLFLQGSDLDIDAVTLLGFDFDDNGKFVTWSPYFNLESKEMFKASSQLPLPTGTLTAIQTSENADNNFFDVYNKYFGTLFKHITLPSGKIKTINGVPELQVDIYTPQGMRLFAEFLRDVKKYGINIKAPVIDGVIDTTDPNFFTMDSVTLEDGTVVEQSYNLLRQIDKGGLGIRPNQVYQIAEQLIQIVNRHNNYLNVAEDHLRDAMVKNYIVHYIYKVAESPCNQTEAMVSVDKSTVVLKDGAKAFAAKSGEDTHAPGRVFSKTKMVGEGQAGKSGVGIGAVGIKANSATQFYISELIDYGSDWDRSKILFRLPHRIAGKVYRGFANARVGKNLSPEEIKKIEYVFDFINSLESKDQVTIDVAQEIAAMLSIAVDNAKDLALAKINSGPRLMGMYVYGMTLGIPTQTLINIMTSKEGLILKEMMEGSQFNNDTTSFRVLDVFKKLNGEVGGDLAKYVCKAQKPNGATAKYFTQVYIKGKNLDIHTNQDALFAAMYPIYKAWFEQTKPEGPTHRPLTLATSFPAMLKQILPVPGLFKNIYTRAQVDLQKYREGIRAVSTPESYLNWNAALLQMSDYLLDMAEKISTFRSPTGSDLKVLAEGAEEMRILGSILGINKGLKTSISDTEAYIDTIENLIYDRKKVKGLTPTEADKIDFLHFMMDEEYQKECIDKYEKVKHSVNILHLITKVPHFKEYLTTQTIPITFFTTASVKYRTLHTYRNNVYSGTNKKPLSIFNLFEVESKRDKEAILKGLENLIQYKLLTRWLAKDQVCLKIPAGFKYFTKKGEMTSNDSTSITIGLHTPEGLATFKKYMEEVCIPGLRDNPLYSQNAFVKNLVRISYDKTPVHSSVMMYSLQGDLMSKQGRQGELNAKMFADFQQLATVAFQPDMGIPSIADAFYLYAQYCYMGRKGPRSLMSVFDLAGSRSSLAHHFNEFTALMDAEGSVNCSEEEVIVWCAPAGTQHLNSKWGYVTSSRTFGVSLQQRIKENAFMTEEQREQMENAYEFLDEEDMIGQKNFDKFRPYRSEYMANHYDRLTKTHFLVPVVSTTTSDTIDTPINLFGTNVDIRVHTKADQIQGIEFSPGLERLLNEKIVLGEITKFTTTEEIRKALMDNVSYIPYKTNLLSDTRQEIDYKLLETIIDQLINC